MTIPEHRKAIDKLDRQIVKLLNERTRHVLRNRVEIKIKAGEAIYAPHRERAVLQRICKLNARADHGRSRCAPFTARSCPAPCRWKSR